MKIEKASVDVLEVPLIHPYTLSNEYGTYMNATPVIVTLYTDEGIVGYGECDPWPLFTGDSSLLCATALCNHILPSLIGKDPTNINMLHKQMDSVIRNNKLSKSAVDMAAYDILGKQLNKPVHDILGGKVRDRIDVMWSIGGSSPKESASEAMWCKEKGYAGCMIKVGTNYKLDADRVHAVRNAVGKDFPIIADANQGWDVDTAIRFCRLIRGDDILFFEQPVQSYDVTGMSKIRKAVDIPISADEGVATIQDAVNFVKEEAADIFSIKVTKNGGIMPAKQICEFAEAHGIKLFFNSMIEEGLTQAASLALGVSSENLFSGIGHAYFSPQRLESDLTDYIDHIKRGYINAIDAPGLGVKLNSNAMKKYTVATYTVK